MQESVVLTRGRLLFYVKNPGHYDAQLYRLYKNLQETYGYSDLDAFLVLKDILGAVWNRIHPTK